MMETEKKQIITIAGRPGSGKSTTAKSVAAQLAYTHFSSGDLFRSVSKEQGQDVLQSNLAAESEAGIPVLDQIVDQRQRELGVQQDRLVVDSRLGWHWIPVSFKVFLDLDLQTAAQRILRDMTPERIQAEHIPTDLNAYALVLQERLESEQRRYKKIYGVDPALRTNYDLVIDTKSNNVEAVVGQIIERFNKWLKS